LKLRTLETTFTWLGYQPTPGETVMAAPKKEFGKVYEIAGSVGEVIKGIEPFLRGRRSKPIVTAAELSLLSFAAVTATVGITGLAFAFEKPEYFEKAHITVVATLWFWALLSGLIYLAARSMSANASFRKTLHAVFRVMPLAYVAGAFLAVTAAVAVKPFGASNLRFILPTAVFIGTQFVVVSYYLPVRLKIANRLGKAATAAMYLVPVVILSINVASAAIPQYEKWKGDQAAKSIMQQTFLPILAPVDVAFLPILDVDKA
jgi:hypothetical protein